MRRLLFLAGLFLAASATAQTAIDITSQAGTCSYPTGAVSSSSTPGHLAATLNGTPSGTGCSTGGSVPAVTFGPASPIAANKTSLVGGTGVSDSFTVLPLNAVSCAAAITTTAGTGTGTLTNGSTVCSSQAACTQTTPFSIPATFTNTSTSLSSTYKVTVTCNAASGAIPATTLSSITVTQAAAASGGTPAANFTFTTSGLTANFLDASTDSGGSIGSWSWNFGDTTSSTAQSPSHTYAAAGTYSVTLTVTDSVSGQQSTTAPQSVTVSAGAACPIIGSSTVGITNFSRLTGTHSVDYQGGGAKTVDVTSFASAYGGAWPGSYNSNPIYTLPVSNYISEQFTVPSNYFTAANVPNPIYGDYTVGQTGFGARVSITISTTCGDFSNPAAYPTTSTVLPGCWLNAGAANAFVQWRKPSGISSCELSGGGTYFLNFINADVSNVTPSGGTAASKKNANCTSTTCTAPVSNGIGNWSEYTPQ